MMPVGVPTNVHEPVAWKAQGVPPLKQVSVGGAAQVVGVGVDGRMLRLDTASRAWQPMPGVAVRAAVGHDGTTWCVNAAQEMFAMHQGQWIKQPGAATHVTVGHAGAIYCANAAGDMFHFANGQWVKLAGVAPIIEAGRDAVYCVNAGGDVFKLVGGSQWQQVPGAKLRTISVASAGSVMGVDMAGNVVELSPSSGQFVAVQGSMPGAASVAHGDTFAFATDGANNVYVNQAANAACAPAGAAMPGAVPGMPAAAMPGMPAAAAAMPAPAMPAGAMMPGFAPTAPPP